MLRSAVKDEDILNNTDLTNTVIEWQVNSIINNTFHPIFQDKCITTNKEILYNIKKIINKYVEKLQRHSNNAL